MAAKNKIPGNWQEFLCNPTNKQDLFAFLSNRVANMDVPAGKEVFITSGQDVKGSSYAMPLCDHEKADTRTVIHLQDALAHGCTKCLVHTVDTDVIVILIGIYHHLLNSCPTADIWGAMSTGKSFTYCIYTLITLVNTIFVV